MLKALANQKLKSSHKTKNSRFLHYDLFPIIFREEGFGGGFDKN